MDVFIIVLEIHIATIDAASRDAFLTSCSARSSTKPPSLADFAIASSFIPG